MKKSIIPNIITIGRILLVVPFLYELLTRQYVPAFYLFFIAGVSDALDGFIARRFHSSSFLGSILDPIADKLLMMTSFIALAWLQLISTWLTVIVILRDLIIIGGVTYVVMIRGVFQITPSFISKVNTAFQLLLVGSVLFSVSIATLPSLYIQSLITIIMVTTIFSLIGYFNAGMKFVYMRQYAKH